jgi:hypothetical protein
MSLNKLDKLIQEILICHNNHFINGKCDLIKIDKAPNSNLIYHFYNDGEITSQKGGIAYKLRSEFTYKPPLIDIFKNINFKLPIILKDNISYAILTEKECNYFYHKLNLLI